MNVNAVNAIIMNKNTKLGIGIICLTWLLFFYVQCSGQSWKFVDQYPFPITDITFSQTGDMYVTQQSGVLYKNGDTLHVFDTWYNNERGLVGVVADSSGENIYLHITFDDTTQNVIKYNTHVNAIDTLFSVKYTNPYSTTHYGGALVLHGDTIYAGFGYGSDLTASQDSAESRGKIIKITPDTSYIYALGLRNPFRATWAEDRLFLSDAGSNVAEELNIAFGGENFGWPCTEGTTIIDTNCMIEYTPPVFMYSQPQPRAVIGGEFKDGYYYWTDHYRLIGGKIDTNGVNIPVTYPKQYITAMAVNPNNVLFISTWDGQIWLLDEPPLALPEIPEEEKENKPYVDKWTQEEIWNLISIWGDIYITMDGKQVLGLPTVPGIYISLWRGTTTIVIE